MPASGEMQAIREKAQALIGNYEERLAAAGVQLTASLRYFETTVPERTYHRAGVPDLIDLALAKKRERKYQNARNNYHCLLLSVRPLEKHLVRGDRCKEYAFVLRKVERAYIGQKPQQTAYAEEKLLPKIEKRIQKILKTAETRGASKAYTNALPDSARYCFSTKYAYKSKMLGNVRIAWNLSFALTLLLLALAVVLIVRAF